MEDPIFSVIIPVFNKWELTRECLASLKKCTKMPYEVIVVDNASSDKTAEFLAPLGKTLFGENFTRIRYEENRNYGPANNAGAKIARAPLLFFLNNDTILTENWEFPLVGELNAHAEVGGVGPLLLYENDTIQHVGVSWNLGFHVRHLYAHFPKTHRVASRKRQVQTLTGAALMMQKSFFLELGCFNEEFCNGFEDVELSMRIINSGKKLYCLPSSVIYHLESQTPGRMRYEKENILILKRFLKHTPVKVDEHIHAFRDGFLPVINNCFVLIVTLCDQEEEELTGRYGTASLDIILDVFQKNFLWRHGRSLLIDHFERNKNYKEASELAFYIASNFPSEKNIKKAHELCLLANQKRKARELENIMKIFLMITKVPAVYNRELQRVHDIGIRQNDSFLLQEVERARKKQMELL